jgi:hypothetical protein
LYLLHRAAPTFCLSSIKLIVDPVVETFVRSTLIAKAASNEVFSWHVREGAFERLNLPWQRFTVIQRKGSIQSKGRVQE